MRFKIFGLFSFVVCSLCFIGLICGWLKKQCIIIFFSNNIFWSKRAFSRSVSFAGCCPTMMGMWVGMEKGSALWVEVVGFRSWFELAIELVIVTTGDLTGMIWLHDKYETIQRRVFSRMPWCLCLRNCPLLNTNRGHRWLVEISLRILTSSSSSSSSCQLQHICLTRCQLYSLIV